VTDPIDGPAEFDSAEFDSAEIHSAEIDSAEIDVDRRGSRATTSFGAHRTG
jgi:hypothetical protein